MKIEDVTALVTGGASGLGGATADFLVRQGANVVLLDVDADRGEAHAAELGDKARFAKADVASEAEVQAECSAQLCRDCDRNAHGG